jgi:hypothetical protein
MSTLRTSCLAAALLLATACASTSNVRGDDDRDASLLVRVDAPERATLYMFAGSERIRLGEINGPGEAMYRIPYMVLARAGQVTVVARIFASTDVIVSDALLLQPGDDIDLNVQTHLKTMYALPGRR